MTRNRPIPHLPDEDKASIRSLILYEDEAMLAFNKPSGLPSQVRGNKATNLDHLLWTFAKSNGKRPRLVHRLDAGTSGVIIAGKTKPAAAALAKQFERGDIQKTYVALVEGEIPSGERGVFSKPIARIETDRGTKMVAQKQFGKHARTRWALTGRSETHTMFTLFPETGRTHQIRLHLADAGCPIMGDRLYGDASSAPRLMLHAEGLSFTHPVTSEMMRINAQIPEDFVALARSLKLANEYGELFQNK